MSIFLAVSSIFIVIVLIVWGFINFLEDDAGYLDFFDDDSRERKRKKNKKKNEKERLTDYNNGLESATFHSLRPTRLSFEVFKTLTEMDSFKWEEYVYFFDRNLPIIEYYPKPYSMKKIYYYYFSFEDTEKFFAWKEEYEQRLKEEKQKEEAKMQRKRDIKALGVLSELISQEIKEQEEIQKAALEENKEIIDRIITDSGK